MRRFFAVLMTLAVAASAQATEKRTLCVYDPAGGNGDVFNMMKDYKAEAVSWGVDFDMKPYTDEKTAAEDFKANKCQAVMMTGTRGRSFLKFAGTIEAMGAMPEYSQLGQVIRRLSNPKAARLMKSGAYEAAAMMPGGAVYLMVRDRTIDTVSELAGKKIATLDFDLAGKTMVKKVGASLVPADVSTFASMFNNGSVDAAYAPATAFKALELYKGIGTKGGVLRYPLAQMTLQVIIRTADFPEGFGQASRTYAYKNFKKALKVVKLADKSIPAANWIEVSDADRIKYDEMFLDVRVGLRDNQKVYDKRMLKLLRKVRCKQDPARAECAQKRE
jgi:hypothetical protein